MKRSSVKNSPGDKNVKIPWQVRQAAALADALVKGNRAPIGVAATPPIRAKGKFRYTDAEIDEALKLLERGKLRVSGPRSEIIRELASEGARHIKARRRGAKQPRQNSDDVTRRLKALIQAYRELSPKRQANPTGQQTLEQLRTSVIEKLGLRDRDDVISEDTIRQDIRQVRSFLRAVQRGIIPRTGSANKLGLSEKTRQEMEAGRRAVAKALPASKPAGEGQAGMIFGKSAS